MKILLIILSVAMAYEVIHADRLDVALKNSERAVAAMHCPPARAPQVVNTVKWRTPDCAACQPVNCPSASPSPSDE